MLAAEAFSPTAIVVDDDPDIRHLVSLVAERAGYRVRSVGNGDELLALIGETQPNLIVLDLQMQETDGIEIMRMLAARQIASKLIILSGEDLRIINTSGEIAKERGLNIRGVFQKPVDMIQLLGLMGDLNRQSRPFGRNDLVEALAAQRLRLHYQPKLDLLTRRITGVEALLRCGGDGLPVVSPESIVLIAETGGLMGRLTGWVFETAIAQAGVWRKKGFDLNFAINISASIANDPALPEQLSRICQSHEVPPSAITLELTETCAMSDQLSASETMVRLRLKGFRLAIDDVGTGYSSLVRLKQLPFSEMKVDRSFAITLDTSRDNAMIVKALIQMARSLELKSVIEGVETGSTLEFAADCGCDEAQGYFIARPADAPTIETFLTQRA